MIAPLDGASAEALEQALALIDAELGDGLLSLDYLRAACSDPTAIVLAAWEGPSLTAIAMGRLLGKEDAGYYQAFGETALRLFEAGPVGSLAALAVVPQSRRRGLGAELIRRRVQWFRENGCAAAIAIAWLPTTYPRGYSAPLFRGLGFSEGARVPDFFLEESARDGWSCPADGNPCRCAASLFWMERLPLYPLL